MTPISEERPLLEPLTPAQQKQLDLSAGRKLVCGALILGSVYFSDEERAKKVCFIANDTIAKQLIKKFKIANTEIFPLQNTEIDFYLHYSGCIHHIEMSAKCNEEALIGIPLEGHLWNVSHSILKEITRQNWHHSLVRADDVPLRKKIGEEEKKTST